MKKVKELFNRKLIFSIISMFVIAGLSFVYISNTNKELKKSEVYDLEVEEKKTNNLEIEEAIKYITIDIKGEVKSPGVYKIEEGKRVVDAINASGGLTKKAVTKYINLSKVLKDEDVIIINNISELKKIEDKKNIEEIKINNKSNISVKESDVITNDKSDIVKESDSNKNTIVNINTCTLEELLNINGIGESKAKSIIEYRENVGLFTSKEDIMKVSGIGNSLYDKIKDYITTE
jgi:competence protein ComEA